jgi:hypothetical protein
MDNEYNTPFGRITWESDSEGLQVRLKQRRHRILWKEITRAGLVKFSESGTPEGMQADILPGLDRLFDLNKITSENLHQLVLARGKAQSRALRIPIPTGDPNAQALVEKVEQQVGARWVGEVSMAGHMKALGIGVPWWFYPLFVVGFILFGYMIILAIGAFAGLESFSLSEIADVPMIAWIALGIWLVIIGYIFLVYRRMR